MKINVWGASIDNLVSIHHFTVCIAKCQKLLCTGAHIRPTSLCLWIKTCINYKWSMVIKESPDQYTVSQVLVKTPICQKIILLTWTPGDCGHNSMLQTRAKQCSPFVLHGHNISSLLPNQATARRNQSAIIQKSQTYGQGRDHFLFRYDHPARCSNTGYGFTEADRYTNTVTTIDGMIDGYSV